MFKSYLKLIAISVGITISLFAIANYLPNAFDWVSITLGMLAVGVITFNEIPAGRRVPWTYVEFDSTGAVSSGQGMPHKIAVIGQMLSTGTATANTPIRVTSYAQAQTLFGAGSMLSFMAKRLIQNNPSTEAWHFPLAAIVGGTQAVGKLAVTVTTATAGTIYLYIAGIRLSIGVTAGMTDAQIATAIVAEITSNVNNLPVTAAVNGTNPNEVDITCNWKGTTGNEIDLSLNYNSGESLPTGVSIAITDMATGATDPDIQDALDQFLDVRYTEIVSPYTDSASLTAISTEMNTRNGATIQLDGYAFMAKNETLGNLSTLGDSVNSQFLLIMGFNNSPSPSWEWASALAARCAFEAQNDPAKPVQTVELTGVLPPKTADRFTSDERNLLLYDGISTFTVDANNVVRMERVITTYKTDATGADDPSYLNWETMATLSYLRYDFRNTFLRKFPRYKLADDGNRLSPGQQILTPKNAKAEAVAIFLTWQELGLVENADAFKESLIVERNIADRDRLDFNIQPDLINQFRVAGVKISFIL